MAAPSFWVALHAMAIVEKTAPADILTLKQETRITTAFRRCVSDRVRQDSGQWVNHIHSVRRDFNEDLGRDLSGAA